MTWWFEIPFLINRSVGPKMVKVTLPSRYSQSMKMLQLQHFVSFCQVKKFQKSEMFLLFYPSLIVYKITKWDSTHPEPEQSILGSSCWTNIITDSVIFNAGLQTNRTRILQEHQDAVSLQLLGFLSLEMNFLTSLFHCQRICCLQVFLQNRFHCQRWKSQVVYRVELNERTNVHIHIHILSRHTWSYCNLSPWTKQSSWRVPSLLDPVYCNLGVFVLCSVWTKAWQNWTLKSVRDLWHQEKLDTMTLITVGYKTHILKEVTHINYIKIDNMAMHKETCRNTTYKQYTIYIYFYYTYM